MTRDHVRAHQTVPLGSVPEVTGLLPVSCARCGARVHLGVPITLSALLVIVEAFTQAHADCQSRGVEDTDE